MDGEVVRPGELAAAQPALEGPGAGVAPRVASQLVTPAANLSVHTASGDV